jgi:hypothetical protein
VPLQKGEPRQPKEEARASDQPKVGENLVRKPKALHEKCQRHPCSRPVRCCSARVKATERSPPMGGTEEWLRGGAAIVTGAGDVNEVRGTEVFGVGEERRGDRREAGLLEGRTGREADAGACTRCKGCCGGRGAGAARRR